VIYKDLKKLIFNCTQDTNWHFRKEMTKHMKVVFENKLSKQSFQAYFYPEIVELINDEDLMVRLEALESVVGLMPTKLSADQIEKDILPAFISHIEKEHDDECN
jgi:hypothetical protein